MVNFRPQCNRVIVKLITLEDLVYLKSYQTNYKNCTEKSINMQFFRSLFRSHFKKTTPTVFLKKTFKKTVSSSRCTWLTVVIFLLLLIDVILVFALCFLHLILSSFSTDAYTEVINIFIIVAWYYLWIFCIKVCHFTKTYAISSIN